MINSQVLIVSAGNIPSVVSGAKPPTKIFRLLGLGTELPCGTDRLASICDPSRMYGEKTL
eukprot:scaffold511234_cov52-Prasinocladus_malaysianus.AAC.2